MSNNAAKVVADSLLRTYYKEVKLGFQENDGYLN